MLSQSLTFLDVFYAARFLGALWLPYRRDAADTKAAIAAAGPVNAVFGHADVVRLVCVSSQLLCLPLKEVLRPGLGSPTCCA